MTFLGFLVISCLILHIYCGPSVDYEVEYFSDAVENKPSLDYFYIGFHDDGRMYYSMAKLRYYVR